MERSVREQLGFSDDEKARTRRKDLRERAAIIDNDHLELIRSRIADRFENPNVVARVRKWAGRQVNPARDIIWTLALAYMIPPRRGLPGASKDLSEAFRDLVVESKIRSLGPSINRYSLYTGPSLIVPSVRGGVLELDVVRGGWLDLRWGDDDPMRSPGAALVETSSGGFLYLDRNGQRVYTNNGDEIVGRRVEVDLDELPAALVPGADPVDFWQVKHGLGLTDATLDAAVFYAQFQYTRKAQSRKQLAVINDDREPPIDGAPAGQAADPETALELNESQGLQVFDLNLSPEAALQQINDIERRQARIYGIPDDVQLGPSNMLAALRAGKLRGQRTEQADLMADAEAQLWRAVWSVVARSDHKHAATLRKYEEKWRDRVLVEFADGTMLEDPLQEETLYEKRAARGATNQAEALQREKPHLTLDEAREVVVKNFQEQAELNRILVTHNTPAPGEPPMREGDVRVEPGRGLQTAEQVTGRDGGIESGATRRGEQTT